MSDSLPGSGPANGVFDSGLGALLMADLERMVSLSRSSTETAAETMTLKPGERRHVTVLFLDMKGFTSLAEKLDHEAVDSLIGKVLAVFGSHIERLGGWIEKHGGDSILAAFGVHVAHEDDAARAVEAALSIIGAFRNLMPALERLGVRTGVRIGIHSGEVTRGRRGAQEVITGDTVNTAARLEQHAEVNSVLVSAATRRIASERFVYQPRSPVLAKGKSAPVEVFTVTGRVPASQRWERCARSAGVGFTARERELVQLEQLYRRCLPPIAATEAPTSTRHLMVTIEGEAGIGKSRLIHEFLRRQLFPPGSDRVAGCEANAVLVGRASLLATSPYELFATMLRGIMSAGSAEADSKGQLEQLVVQAAEQLDDGMTLRRNISVLGFMIGLEYDDPRLGELNPEQLQMEILISLRALVEGLARRAFRELGTSLVIVCEDFQWATEPAKAALAFVMANARTQLPLFFLVTHRPGAALPEVLESRIRTERLNLRPLTAVECGSLVSNILGEQEVASEVVDLILSRGAGNPFFVEELTLHMLDTSLISERDGCWRLRHGVRTTGIPSSLRGLILSRLDSLDHGSRQTLQTASVLGLEILPHAMRWCHDRITDLPHPEAHLDELVDLAFLLPPGGSRKAYVFKHAMTRNVVYETILHHNRRVLHRLYADYLERHVAESPDTRFLLLADNWRGAGELEKARSYFLKAGDQARRLFDNETAIEAYSAAFDLLEDDHPSRATAIRKRGAMFQFTGRLEQAERDLIRGLALARDSGSRSEESAALYCLGSLHAARSQHDTALEYLRQAQSDSRERGDRLREGICLLQMARTFEATNEYETAQSCYGEALQMARQTGSRKLEAEVLCQAGLLHRRQSRFDEALVCFSDALKISTELGDRLTMAMALEAIGNYYQNLTEFSSSAACMQRALAIRKETGDRKGEAQLNLTLGINHLMREDYRSAADHLDRSLAVARESGYRQIEGTAWSSKGDLLRLRGRYHDALESFQNVLSIDREASLGVVRALAVFGRGSVRRILGEIDQARADMLEAQRALEKAGNLFGQCCVCEGMGEIHRDLGAYGEALSSFRTCADMFAAAGGRLQTFWQVRARRRIGEVYFCLGQLEQAESCLKEIVASSRPWRSAQRFEEAEALFWLGNCDLARGRNREAVEHYLGAITIFDDLELPYRSQVVKPMLARARLRLGDLSLADELSAGVLEWLQRNPQAVEYRDMRSEQGLLTRHLVLAAADAPDAAEPLGQAHQRLTRVLDLIDDVPARRAVADEPFNRELLECWRLRGG